MKTVEIQNIKKSIMGTMQFEMKATGHRGWQKFICYPLNGNNQAERVKIQSDKRIGWYYPGNGTMELTKSIANGAYAHHLAYGPLVSVHLTEIDNQELKLSIFTSADKNAGTRGVHSDNSGAIRII